MPTPRDWDKDLAKIERQIGSMSDSELLEVNAQERLKAAATAPPPATVTSAATPAVRVPGKWNAYTRVFLALGLGLGIIVWPYGHRCGWPLVGYMAVTGIIVVISIWASVGTWKARRPAGHILALLLTLWGLLLGAREILPRVGYAIPSEARPAVWLCN